MLVALALVVPMTAGLMAAWFHPPFGIRALVVIGQQDRAVAPVQIADSLYYVGTRDAASFLIVSESGHILIDGGYPGSPTKILASIRQLGFDPRDIKILLNTHGHFDHAGGLAELKRQTGATLLASPLEAELLEQGGRNDPWFADHLSYEPVTVDHRLQHGETIRLGEAVLTAHFTPGHTKGCTSWTITAKVAKVDRQVLLFCSLSQLGIPMKGHAAYPNIADDFRTSLKLLKALPCDVFLTPHALQWGLRAKRAKREAGDASAFVDPEGCRAYLGESEARFTEALSS